MRQPRAKVQLSQLLVLIAYAYPRGGSWLNNSDPVNQIEKRYKERGVGGGYLYVMFLVNVENCEGSGVLVSVAPHFRQNFDSEGISSPQILQNFLSVTVPRLFIIIDL